MAASAAAVVVVQVLAGVLSSPFPSFGGKSTLGRRCLEFLKATPMLGEAEEEGGGGGETMGEKWEGGGLTGRTCEFYLALIWPASA